MTDYARIGFKPYKEECVQCGLPYTKTDPRQRLCPECRTKNTKASRAQYRRETYHRLKEGKPKTVDKRFKPKPPPDTRHICEVSGTCEYGKPDGEDYNCNYFTATGKLRTEGGLHQIRDGRCDLYRPRTRDKSGWQRGRDKKMEKEGMKNEID